MSIENRCLIKREFGVAEEKQARQIHTGRFAENYFSIIQRIAVTPIITGI